MRTLPCIIPFFLSIQVVCAAKRFIPRESDSGSNIKLSGEAKSPFNVLELDELLKLEQVNTILGESPYHGTNVSDALDIMSSSPTFQENQIPFIEEAIKKGYNNYLKFILTFSRRWWQREEDYHWFLALSYNAPWCSEEWWDKHQPQLDWPSHMDALFKADNVAFAVAHPDIFNTTLRDPIKITKLAIKHDSVKLTEHYVKDLDVFATQVPAMVTAGSMKIMRLLFDQDIPLGVKSNSLEIACDLEIWHLLYVKGYQVKIEGRMIDNCIMTGRLAHLELFYKISKGNLPSHAGVETAAIFGHLEAVKWAVSKNRGLLPPICTLQHIARGGHLEMLEWIFKQTQGQVVPCSVIIGAASGRHDNILDWAYKTDPSILQRCEDYLLQVKGNISKSGKAQNGQWLGGEKSLHFEARDLTSAVENNHLNVLKLAYSLNHRALPTISNLNFAAAKGYLEILKWTHSINDRLIPNIAGANSAAAYSQIPVLEWLALKNVCPDQKGLDFCIMTGQVEALHWTMQKFPDMAPSHHVILKAVNVGHLGVVKYLYKKMPHLLDYPALLAEAKTKGWDRIVAFLETNTPTGCFHTI